jgi:hypothetical protein
MKTIEYFETQTLVTETCINCGVLFAIPQDLKRGLRENHKNFYCPNGHSMFYPGESEAERFAREKRDLENKLRIEREYKEDYMQQRDKLQKELSRHKIRTKNGVCPCCKRSFQNLRRHIEAKHPGYK